MFSSLVCKRLRGYVFRHGQETKAYWLFNDLRLGESKHLDGIYYVDGQASYLSGSKIKDKEGKPELQILVSYCNAEEALDMYKLRWQVETMFRGPEAQAAGCKPVQVRTGLHLPVPCEPHQPLSNQCFQIFVIYLVT